MLTGRAAAIALRAGISIAILVLLASWVEWRNLGELFALDWRFAAPAIALAGAGYVLQAWRWQVLLRAQALSPPSRWTHGVFWIAQFYNCFLPSGVAGDAVRFGYLWRRNPERKIDGAMTLVADRVLGLGALLALAVPALGLYLLLHEGREELRLLFGAGLGGAVVLAAATWALLSAGRLESVFSRLLGAERLSTLRLATSALTRRRGALAAAVSLSLMVWVVDFASIWFLALSVGLYAGPLEMTLGAAAAYLAAALPISIGGHGVREGALLAVLVQFNIGVGEPQLLASLGLLFWSLSVGWSLLGGALLVTSLALGWPLPAAAARFSGSPGA